MSLETVACLVGFVKKDMKLFGLSHEDAQDKYD